MLHVSKRKIELRVRRFKNQFSSKFETIFAYFTSIYIIYKIQQIPT